MIHEDIVHTYIDGLACGLRGANHSRCTVFHDTENLPAVMRAVKDISRETGKRLCNFLGSYGLGIEA